MILDLIKQLDLSSVSAFLEVPLEMVRPAKDEVDEWLRNVALSVIGRLTWDDVVRRHLEAQNLWGAIERAIAAEEDGNPIDATTHKKLEDAWSSQRDIFTEKLSKTRAKMQQIEASEFAEYLETIPQNENLFLSTTPPRTRNECGASFGQQSILLELEKSVLEIENMLEEHRRDQLKQLRGAAIQAFSRVVQETDGRSGSRTTQILQAIPEFFENRDLDMLKRIADPGAQLDGILMPNRSSFVTWTSSPSAPADSPFSTQDLETGPTSRFLRGVYEQALPGDDACETERAFDEFSNQLRTLRTTREVTVRWFSAAKSTKSPELRALAIAEGCRAEGRFRFQQDPTGFFALHALREAFVFAVRADHIGYKIAEEVAVEFLAMKCLSRRRRSGSDQGPFNIDEWLAHPPALFSWIEAGAHYGEIASEWVLFDPPIARRLIDVVAPRLVNLRELLKVCTIQALRREWIRKDPHAVFERILIVLEEVKTEALRAKLFALSDAVQHALDKGGTGAATVRESVASVDAILRQISVPTNAPISALLESLRHLPTMLAVSEPNEKPKITTLQLVKTLFPASRFENVIFPVLIRNGEDAALARDVNLRLALEDGERGDRAGRTVTIGVASQPVGNIHGGEEREVHFELTLDEESASVLTEIRFNLDVEVDGAIVERKNLKCDVRPGKRDYPPSPYQTGRAVVGDKFVGRKRETQRLIDAIIGTENPRVPAVHGIRRIGKTSLLHRVLADVEVKRRFACTVWSLEDLGPTTSSADFLLTLCERVRDLVPPAIHGALRFKREELREAPYEAFENFVRSLNGIELHKRILVLFDEFDNLLHLIANSDQQSSSSQETLGPKDRFDRQLLGALRKVAVSPGNLHFGFAGLPTILEHRYQDRFFGLFESIPLGSFSPDEAAEIIAESAQLKKGLRPEAKNYLIYATGLQPYLLQVVCHELLSDAMYSGRDVITQRDVESVIKDKVLSHEEYFVDYARLAGNHRDVLWGLALALRGGGERRFASVREVTELLRVRGFDLPSDRVHAALEELGRAGKTSETERGLVERAANARDRYRLVIGILGDYLIRKKEGV